MTHASVSKFVVGMNFTSGSGIVARVHQARVVSGARDTFEVLFASAPGGQIMLPDYIDVRSTTYDVRLS